MGQAPNGEATEGRDDRAFGELAVREKACSPQQVREALEIQERLRSMGIEPKRLGDILIEKGHLTREQAERIFRLQSRHPARSGRMAIPGYEILAKIGQGGMGAVYKARQISMDRTVAIKVLAPKHSRDEKYVQRFLNEARAVARLNHENVITGIDVGEAGGVHYFVMEYVEGTTVSRLLADHGRIEEKRCLQVALQVARALDHAYRHGILHRDIKPENIMITGEGVAKLCDLGLAKRTEGPVTAGTDAFSVGTPNYISPEQARGEQNLDIRTDIYSLGATLYTMSTGRTPFSGPTALAVMTKHVSEHAEPVRKVNPALSEGFNALVERMMQKRRQDRYQTPQMLIEDIERLLRGEVVSGPPQLADAGPPQAPAPIRGVQTAVLVAVAAALILVGLLLVMWMKLS